MSDEEELCNKCGGEIIGGVCSYCGLGEDDD